MSDLEATSSHAQSAAPITTVAAGKLRGISGSQRLFAGSDGLVDAFAEVFARMAESSTPPVEPPARSSETEDEPSVADQPATRSDGAAEPKPEPNPPTAESVDDLLAENTDVERVNKAEGPVSVERSALADKPNQIGGNVEVQVSEEIAAAVEHEELAEFETDAVAIIAPEVVPSDGNGHSRRHRRESASARSIHGAVDGHRKIDRSLPADANDTVGQEIVQANEQSVSQWGQSAQAEPTRRLRGRPRYTSQTADHQPSPVSHAGSVGTQPRAAQVTGIAPSGEPIAGQSPQSDAARSPAIAETIESQMANVQGVQASANRSGSPARVQSGARGLNQSIESTVPARNAASAKPESRRADSNTKEMVSRIKLVQRVSKAFQHLGPEGGVVRLRLAPAEMGAVRVEMRIHQRKVQARVVAETEAASTALREHLPDLRARLESFGMQVDRIEIETDSHDLDQRSHWHDEPHGRQQQRGNRQNHRQLHQPGADGGESVSPKVSHATAVNPAHAMTNGVDVRL